MYFIPKLYFTYIWAAEKKLQYSIIMGALKDKEDSWRKESPHKGTQSELGLWRVSQWGESLYLRRSACSRPVAKTSRSHEEGDKRFSLGDS